MVVATVVLYIDDLFTSANEGLFGHICFEEIHIV